MQKTVWGAEPANLNAAVGTGVLKELQRLRMARQGIEDIWMLAWSAYLNTQESRDAVRANITEVVGDVEGDWRHKINRGKAFSLVETAHSYMMQAQFPSRQWFSSKPTDRSKALEAKAINEYVLKMMDRNNYVAQHDVWLRQLLITGTSVMGLPYRYDTIKQRVRRRVEVPVNVNSEGVVTESKVVYVQDEQPDLVHGAPAFEVVNTLDVYLDPNIADPNDPRSTFIRVVRKRRSEVVRLMKQGHFQDNTKAALTAKASVSTTTKSSRDVQHFEGIKVAGDMSDEIDLLEYWGDLHLDGVTYHDVMAVVLADGTVLSFKANPYWAGRPYVVGQYIPTANQPYSIGMLQPSLGLLFASDNLLNHRLDAMELSIDPMYEVSSAAGLDDEEIYSEPGRVFRTNERGSINPIPTGDKAYTLTYNEIADMDRHIDANSGTPGLVSSGQVRAGERVTAQEIQAIKDAGGNRLSGVFARIETTSVKALLKKVYRMLQQFADEELEVAINTGEEVMFVAVDPSDLTGEYELIPLGSNHVIEREQFIKQRTDLLAIASQLPELMQKLNLDTILEDIVGAFGFEDPERYLQGSTAPASMPEQVQAPSPEQEALQELTAMGGQAFADSMMVEGNGNPSLGIAQQL